MADQIEVADNADPIGKIVLGYRVEVGPVVDHGYFEIEVGEHFGEGERTMSAANDVQMILWSQLVRVLESVRGSFEVWQRAILRFDLFEGGLKPEFRYPDPWLVAVAEVGKYQFDIGQIVRREQNPYPGLTAGNDTSASRPENFFFNTFYL